MNWKKLISENGTDVSVGRMSFWTVFIVLLVYWVGDLCGLDRQVPDSLLYAFMALLTYNTTKKFATKFSLKDKVIETE